MSITKYKNNTSSSTVTASLAPGDVALIVTTGTGAALTPPSGYHYIATLINAAGTVIEIVKITGGAADTLTIARAQESTTAQTFAAGSKIELRITAGILAALDPIKSVDFRLAAGDNAVVSGGYGTVYGSFAEAAGFATALGYNARALTDNALAFGISASAFARDSIALGGYSDCFAEGCIRTWGVPVVGRDPGGWYYDQTEPNYLASWPAIISSPPVDLGVPPVWSATTFDDGDVISASPAVGANQYYLSTHYGLDETNYDTLATATNQQTETTQPSFPTGLLGDAVNSPANANSQWTFINPATGVDISVSKPGYAAGQVMFYPKRVGFVVQKWTTGSNPTISVGNESNATAYVNAQALNGAGGQHYFKWFEVLEGVAAQRLIFKRDSAGSGRFMGRFLVEGVFVQLPG